MVRRQWRTCRDPFQVCCGDSLLVTRGGLGYLERCPCKVQSNEAQSLGVFVGWFLCLGIT